MPDFDSTAAVFKSGPAQLLKIMNLDKELPGAWKEPDRPQMLRHTMTAALEAELKTKVGDGNLGPSAGIKTFQELFQHPQPPLKLLQLAKDFFKAKAGAGANRRPDQEVAYLLYLLTIVTARVRLGVSVSSLTDLELLPGLDWALAQTWLDRGSHQLFSEARRLSERR
jgi:hypothetical protein